MGIGPLASHAEYVNDGVLLGSSVCRFGADTRADPICMSNAYIGYRCCLTDWECFAAMGPGSDGGATSHYSQPTYCIRYETLVDCIADIDDDPAL